VPSWLAAVQKAGKVSGRKVPTTVAVLKIELSRTRLAGCGHEGVVLSTALARREQVGPQDWSGTCSVVRHQIRPVQSVESNKRH
jgi:hypothetical protein